MRGVLLFCIAVIVPQSTQYLVKNPNIYTYLQLNTRVYNFDNINNRDNLSNLIGFSIIVVRLDALQPVKTPYPGNPCASLGPQLAHTLALPLRPQLAHTLALPAAAGEAGRNLSLTSPSLI
jgi:hypothetical protein